MDEGVLRQTVADLVAPSRGILAADESTGTIKRRFDSIGAESTEENRRAYRSLLLTTAGIGEYICGVILFEETLGQADGNGTPLPELAAAAGVVPGIKVDKGTKALPGAPGDLITEGLDGLAGRLDGYKEQGARFAKWREVYNITDTLPSALAISANAEVLARYARICQEAGVVPGIKVDKGTKALPGAPGDLITEGLDGLAGRLEGYKEQGARFAKWREVYNITDTLPSALAISANAEVLARYARICQEAGVVPIVEPEVLMDGGHTIERCAEVTEAVLHAVFAALDRHRVLLEGIVLKPNMVLPGSESGRKASPEEVADATLTVFRRAVPAAVPTINFLSGGQSAVESTENLNAINTAAGEKPWALSFSYGRGLQAPALAAWGGKVENESAAQAAFIERARLNGLARDGRYEGEPAASAAS